MIAKKIPVVLLLATSACMQNPSEVVMRGGETFDRSHYASLISNLQPAAGISETQQSVPAASIEAKDLEAPKEPSHVIIPAKPIAKEPAPQKITMTQPVSAHVLNKPSSALLMWPVASKKIISEFGPKGSGIVSEGINIAAKEGDPVWAAADGEVVYVGNHLRDFGNMMIIKHSAGKTTSYAHMGRIASDKYDRVKQGDIIGYVGRTGSIKSPQLHFAVRDGNEPVDPMRFLGRNLASVE